MISRRNIRVKVMQTLYAIDVMDEGVEENMKQAHGLLDKKLIKTLDIFTHTLVWMVDIAQYANTDAANRSKRLLQTEADKNVSTKLANNQWIERLLANESFVKKRNRIHQTETINQEWVKRLYNEFCESEAYLKYVSQADRTGADEKNIVLELWDFIKNHELFNDFLNDEVSAWEEDKQQVDMLVENLINGQQKFNFDVPLSPEKNAYAHDLLATAIEKKEVAMDLIKPKLQNWDAERVALIDLILLRMGVCELLYFPTIPTKVTINEYIEIAKQFSTRQSSQFVNGVLDNIQKELHQSGRISKQERFKK